MKYCNTYNERIYIYIYMKSIKNKWNYVKIALNAAWNYETARQSICNMPFDNVRAAYCIDISIHEHILSALESIWDIRHLCDVYFQVYQENEKEGKDRHINI